MESSRSVVMITCRAWATPARRSTSRRVASPVTTASPSACASPSAVLLGSTTTIRSAVDPVVLQGLDRAAALGAVADHDHVVVHALPPSGDPEHLSSLGGQHLQRRPDQQDQERDPQRRDDEGVDQPGVLGERRDVAVAGRAEGDGRVVDRVDQVDLPGRVGVVDVAAPVDVHQRDRDGQDPHRQQQPPGQLPPRGALAGREPDTPTGLLLGDVGHAGECTARPPGLRPPGAAPRGRGATTRPGRPAPRSSRTARSRAGCPPGTPGRGSGRTGR